MDLGPYDFPALLVLNVVESGPCIDYEMGDIGARVVDRFKNVNKVLACIYK